MNKQTKRKLRKPTRDKEVVATVFRQLADSGSVELIITTGATDYLGRLCSKAVE